MLPLFLQIHIVESTIHHSLMRTVHPFFQERSCILHFPFWRNFSILSFYKKYSASLCKTTCFTPSRIPKGCADSKQSLRPLSFLSRTGNVFHSFRESAFACLLFNKVEEVQHSIVIPSDSHSGINYPPFAKADGFETTDCLECLQILDILIYGRRAWQQCLVATGYKSSI